jgi:hypothetical protein
MIKFYRHIRQNLLNQGKTTKYLKYAIGEIILVVIGILIALQINNWNEKRHQKDKEIEILKAFKSQLNNDLKEFDQSLEFYRGAKESMNIILNYLYEDLPYQDSLKHDFFEATRIYGTSDLSNSVFETLKSTGIDLISNQELRNKIVTLYDDADSQIENFEKKYSDILFNASQNVLNTRFIDFWQGDYKSNYQGEMVPVDFEKLKTDQEYIYFLRTLRNEMGWLLERPIEDTKIYVTELLQDIDQAIKTLETD